MTPTASAPPSPIAASERPVRAGQAFPQGATPDESGVNFALYSEVAEAVEVCLFNAVADEREAERIPLRGHTNGVWHGHVEGLRPGQLYGFRVHGPYDPRQGLRCNPHKLLLDPYARGVGRCLRWDDSLFGYTVGHVEADLSFDTRDSAPFAPLGMVVDGAFDWSGDVRPSHPWHETIIYEAHVRGLTMRHPDIPEPLRGTYAAVASDPILRHLENLGVTAIELMPVHHFVHDRHLLDRGLRNYWGYNTLGFFAPEPGYASREHPERIVREFKAMVARLHAAGIEVILDVVYNHTAEGNHLGPTLSFRGIDNRAYYRTVADDPRHYMDYTGCGNTLNMVHPKSLQLLMDSLRYWVTEMHVDGFRFDLAAALARELHDVDRLGAFFDTIYQDPTLAAVKLIAEPWDLGEGGYQVGKFPPGWTEWNGRYRDTVRKYWKGDMGMHADVATRLNGSADLYEASGRQPSASINFVTAHDGFTLEDLVSYESKHNEANGEENRDGADDNNAWNCGHEGPAGDPAVVALRERQKRNLWCTLLFSQGVPMICAGDELSRTQGGNNNAYCQDNEISWLDWKLDDRKRAFLEFAAHTVQLRRRHPNFRRRSFKDPAGGGGEGSVHWFRSDGQAMGPADWEDGGWMRTLGMYLDGTAAEVRDREGQPVADDDFLLLLNAHDEPVKFRIPPPLASRSWRIIADTARDPAHAPPAAARGAPAPAGAAGGG
ncbi:MAG TPA: glycogen debranching protein GlgX, partial [Opitutaceae bacterium]|nr:glycogen debranching protein GlgX [Opitutaceae bacterium]